MKVQLPKGTQICFPVGDGEVVSVQVTLSGWSGLEVYTANGAEVHRVRNEASHTSQTFEVGSVERHKVEFRAWVEGKHLRAEAFVDGLRVRGDLLPARRRWTLLGDR